MVADGVVNRRFPNGADNVPSSLVLEYGEAVNRQGPGAWGAFERRELRSGHLLHLLGEEGRSLESQTSVAALQDCRFVEGGVVSPSPGLGEVGSGVVPHVQL